MSKKHFIALADMLRSHGIKPEAGILQVTNDRLCEYLADFCASQNPRFNRSRWLSYVAGKCGPNGGAING